jgi:hypothetical protein
MPPDLAHSATARLCNNRWQKEMACGLCCWSSVSPHRGTILSYFKSISVLEIRFNIIPTLYVTVRSVICYSDSLK